MIADSFYAIEKSRRILEIKICGGQRKPQINQDPNYATNNVKYPEQNFASLIPLLGITIIRLQIVIFLNAILIDCFCQTSFQRHIKS